MNTEARGWVIAMPDWFGATIYYVMDGAKWVFGKDAHEARIYSDAEKAETKLPDGGEWKPATDLALNKSGERNSEKV